MNTKFQWAFVVVSALALCAAAQTNDPGKAAAVETSCRPCHTVDRPTHEHAALSKCTRVEPRGTHTVAEGPDMITMSEGTGYYGRVVFSHKVHAEMSVTSGGCIECHHEATAGHPMRRCNECHSPQRERADVVVPDLRGAIHRQCLSCHTVWDPDTRCASCHEEGPTVNAPGEPKAHSLVLYKFHREVTCQQCHKDKRKAGKLEAECKFCHEDLAKSFDHRKTGLALDGAHVDASCDDCHKDATFATPPSCADCHDDKSYPANLPGKMVHTAAVEGAGP